MPSWTPRTRHLVAAALISLAAASTAEARDATCPQRDTPNIIQPGNPLWAKDLNVYPGQAETNNAALDITATNPRSGTGSLELTTTGDLFDWAFFKRVAPGDAWGLLSAVNCLTFDWYRSAYTLPDPAPAALTAETWQEQTPVLRLLVKDVQGGQTVISHLVWERWYNTVGVVDPTENDTWHFENLSNQLFWRHIEGGLTYTNAGCKEGSFIDSASLQTFSLTGWIDNCYSSSAQVFGIMVGVGSAWPGEYHGFVDNVQLKFAGDAGFTVEDNFDFPADTPTDVVPEPATISLLAMGLALVGFVASLGRRRRA